MLEVRQWRVIKLSLAAATLAALGAMALLVTWWAETSPLQHRPTLVTMLFTAAVVVAVCAAGVAALVTCHLSTSKAFAAGVRVGRELPGGGEIRRGLRIVE